MNIINNLINNVQSVMNKKNKYNYKIVIINYVNNVMILQYKNKINVLYVECKFKLIYKNQLNNNILMKYVYYNNN